MRIPSPRSSQRALPAALACAWALLLPFAGCTPRTAQVVVLDTTFQKARQWGATDDIGALALNGRGQRVFVPMARLVDSLTDPDASFASESRYESFPEGSNYRLAYDALRATPGVEEVREIKLSLRIGGEGHLLHALADARVIGPLPLYSFGEADE